jgi:glycolate dehydrogenase FAD-linked subunit
MSVISMPTPDPAILARRDEIIETLQAVCDSGTLIDDLEGRRAFECDALTAYRAVPLAVVLPATTHELAAIMRICHAFNVPIVPRGAGTSLCGGALPTGDAVVIGVSRMARILEIDTDNLTIRVEAGATNLSVTRAVEHLGLFYAPDPSSQLACAIGGNIAMNSGGAHCLKYGVTTNNLLGVTMVMADGEVVEIGGEFFDPAQYDFLGLVCGSEGQLGIVTEAVLKVIPAPEGALPMLIGFDSAGDAGACVASIIRSGLIPVALEYMDALAIKVCDDFSGAGYPLDVEAMLIVEVEGSPDEISALLARIDKIAEKHNKRMSRIAASPEEAAAIWVGRKAAFGAIGQIADYICMDGAIPTQNLVTVLGEIDALGKKYGLGVANIFHAGDGNLHPLVLYDANDPAAQEKAEKMGADILLACVKAGGCLTGEHGVGVEKRELMTAQFGPEDLNQQVAVKSALDPQWLLNPAKVFPLAYNQRRTWGAGT